MLTYKTRPNVGDLEFKVVKELEYDQTGATPILFQHHIRLFPHGKTEKWGTS